MNPQRRPLLCADLDGTMLGDSASLAQFAVTWADIRTQTGAALAYVTGRSPANVINLLANHPLLPQPEAFAGDVGTSVYLRKEGGWRPVWNAGEVTQWKRDLIQQILNGHPALILQPPECQSLSKISWFIKPNMHCDIQELAKHLVKADLKAELIKSDNRYLDVLPPTGAKAGGVIQLRRLLKGDISQTLVAGDTGNDTSMFQLRGTKGILVSNAHPELCEATNRLSKRVYKARHAYAAGVLEGCIHWLSQVQKK